MPQGKRGSFLEKTGPYVFLHPSKKKPVDHFLVQHEPKRLTGDDLYMKFLKTAVLQVLTQRSVTFL